MNDSPAMPHHADAEQLARELEQRADALLSLGFNGREIAAMVRGSAWRPIESAPKDGTFVILFCPEDQSRWWASWQTYSWYGCDELGLTRDGHSAGDPNAVTGWFVTHWQPLPAPPEADPT